METPSHPPPVRGHGDPDYARKRFVAVNFIDCRAEYEERFESLFASRARAIDRMHGFIDMYVLKLKGEKGKYLIVSHWESEEAFQNWTKSPEFLEGHRRGFEDVRKAKERGEDPPMSSLFKVYEVIAR
jgi:heme-degrading monooxygenase HmoA